MATADLLKTYRQKRDFARTSEPSGKAASGDGRAFVVQKHDASRLHYDFRLELDGVLKSWAVTRGPSLDPGEKRLAVRTEDHPLDYADFEGTIPEGEYGGGTVMLWDTGTWEPLHDPQKGLAEGKLHFRLHGERMKGGWALVRMRPRGREKRENWLLIKERDETADEADKLLEKNVVSIATGRSMREIAEAAPARKAARNKTAAEGRRKQAKPGKAPKFRAPQLATLVDSVPEGAGWVHEMKYDGYRLLVALGEGGPRFYTRSGQDWTEKLAKLAAAFAPLHGISALIDGELVAFNDRGRTDFSCLQQALGEGGETAFFAFDLLQVESEDITGETLLERKQKLRELLKKLPKSSPIQFSEHVRGKGEKVLAAICEGGHEGIIAKKALAPYRSRRTRTWLKIKCVKQQEFVVGGWSPSDRRAGFSSLLLGTYENGELVYRGRVGTGFSADDLARLSARLKKLERKTSPFVDVPRQARKGAHWVRPDLVAEIAFTEFTGDMILRHPSFLGLRQDKAASEVSLEEPMPAPKSESASKPSKGGRKGGKPASGSGKEGAATEIAGVRLSSPDRIVFPGQGLTKRALAEYYLKVADAMLPTIAERPLSLVRCPQGREGECFFQKHDSGGFPAEMKRLAITESSGEKASYFYIDDAAGLIAAVQMGVREFHIWGARIDAIEKPERLIFDLDPDEGLGFSDVKRAAFHLRERLAELGLESFPLLTGGKGVHVVAPLVRRREWPEVKAFCKAFAVKLAAEAPDRYVATMSKAKRKGRIFIDYLRNERGSTAIAPFSTRAREGAPVATPLAWEELSGVKAAGSYDVESLLRRLGALKSAPWEGYFRARQSLTKAMLEAVGAG
ncbi:DNA ligase D [Afifella pfennigii]|uniref:DNA ligase D n=1 Tax=Afifella pfennigii TaxID=209897 RepID=UPI00047E8FE4|nr:DNA ligase D [Afifella pfennigii]